MRWLAWALRLWLVAIGVYQVVSGNTAGALVAAEGIVVTLLPLLIRKLSNTSIPAPVEVLYVIGIALQFTSESLKLFELFTYWDKIVHPTLVALTSWLSAWLLLGYRDSEHKRMPIHMIGAIALLIGISVGALWEYVEFLSDWFGDANLQKSNADTMTDLIANDIGAFVATLVGLHLYPRWLTSEERTNTGRLAQWLTHGPHELLDRHGRIIAAAAAAVFVAAFVGGRLIDQGTPALAAGLQPGTSLTWTGLTDPATTLAGDWVPDPQRGTCRENPENPKPGSEKAGLLQLAPGTSYRSFAMESRVFEERPPREEGTQMDGGVAFGIRDKDNYYLLEESALHDVLRLSRYIHGRRRDVREELVRTHGNEWHTLALRVNGGHVETAIDGQPAFAVDDVPDTDGGVGLWARVAAATCFMDTRVTVQ